MICLKYLCFFQNFSEVVIFIFRKLKAAEQPVIFYDKAGVELPVFEIAPVECDPEFAAYTGPDGGITQVKDSLFFETSVVL